MRAKVAQHEKRIDAYIADPEGYSFEEGETPMGDKKEVLTNLVKDYKICLDTYKLYAVMFMEKYG